MHKAYVGVGSNISPEKNIDDALMKLTHHVTVTGVSTFYRTKPLKRRDQNDYLNGVWRIQMSLSPEELKYAILNAVERELHRRRTGDKYASRTIDLDLLLYDDLVASEGTVILPDPDIYLRPFIAHPLFELEPELILPDTRTPISVLAETMPMDGLTPDTNFTVLLRRRIENE